MKLLVSEIPGEGLDVSDDVALEPAGNAVLVASVQRTGTEVRLAGSLRAEMQQTCSRCLKQFMGEFEMPLGLVFLPEEEMPRTESGELAPDEMNTGFYRDGELDLGDVAREQAMLSLSMKPLCSDSCRGICPHCGADLVEGGCECGCGLSDPRMEPLRELRDSQKANRQGKEQ